MNFALYIFQGQEYGFFLGSETLSSYNTMSILIRLFEPASNLSLLYLSSSLIQGCLLNLGYNSQEQLSSGDLYHFDSWQ